MKKLSSLIIAIVLFSSYGPGNCNLYEGDCKKACHTAEESIKWGQGSRKSQELFDKAIEECPTFDYPYYEKAVPYAKRGEIAEWKRLIDKAVEIDPVEHLANRGWYHWFFLHNYEAAIRDIDLLDSLKSEDIGTTGDATYHLNIMKGICYFELGDTIKAIEIIKNQMNEADHFVSLYDHIVLGAMYLSTNQFKQALSQFEKQAINNDLAENHYYSGVVYLKLNEKKKAKVALEQALLYYNQDKTMENGYRELPFEIYREDIEIALNTEL